MVCKLLASLSEVGDGYPLLILAACGACAAVAAAGAALGYVWMLHLAGGDDADFDRDFTCVRS